MMGQTKIIALYLPQFHRIPENDEFWGEGFTDWITVREAKPLFPEHKQPRVPLNDNYYDLSLVENVRWQADLAASHGIYGFGVYHYWFNNDKNLLVKPAELLRDMKDCPIKYFMVWDNCNWKRSWSNVSGNDWAPEADGKGNKEGPDILVPYIIGEMKDWEVHYNYLRSHFHSDNYILKDNKPVFCIINYDDKIYEMANYLDELAQKDGFDGIFFIYRNKKNIKYPKDSFLYTYEPHYSAWRNIRLIERMENYLTSYFHRKEKIYLYDYDKIWQNVIKTARKNKDAHIYHGAFISYDDSPRRGRNRSRIIRGFSPEKFEGYFKELLSICSSQNKEYLFLTAWNEWSEGAFMEPDVIYNHAVLTAIRNAVLNI